MTDQELRRPTAPETLPGCSIDPIFNQWNESVWLFGTNQELPSLLNLQPYRDTDGDGVFDNVDVLPFDSGT